MKCKPLIVNYGVHFNTILFPLKLIEITDSLEKKGYELSPSLPFPRPPGRPAGAGEIARKGKTVIQIDTSAQMLMIADVSVDPALACYDELVKMFAEDYGINIDNFVRFYQFTATYEIPTEKEAYEAIAKNLNATVPEEFEKIIGEKIWPYELRFAGAGLKANSENWFDISVRPNYERNDSFIISTVYRNSDKAKAQHFVKVFEDKILKIIDLINR